MAKALQKNGNKLAPGCCAKNRSWQQVRESGSNTGSGQLMGTETRASAGDGAKGQTLGYTLETMGVLDGLDLHV